MPLTPAASDAENHPYGEDDCEIALLLEGFSGLALVVEDEIQRSEHIRLTRSIASDQRRQGADIFRRFALKTLGLRLHPEYPRLSLRALRALR
jgi:hypothetical protein